MPRLPEFLKPYWIGQRIFPPLIRRMPLLKYVPVFRDYAPGGEFDPNRDLHPDTCPKGKEPIDCYNCQEFEDACYKKEASNDKG